MTLIWALLLMLMLTYVVSSMVGVAFNLQTALLLGVGVTVLVYVIPAILPNPAEQDSHQ
ncbi:YjzD family protein [Niallia sp. XMNu-256]|uniref:YjzD family protein n=1 Tax=Niallia sp. XMNu-256 TaxID=3082444 RepID=UPI0030CA6A63